MQAYSDSKRENDPNALPDIEIFQLTATEVVAMDEELVWEYGKRPEFRLHSMNSRVRNAMLETIVEEENITGGWFWQSCFPGCLPDGNPFGPFESEKEALADAQA
jgi:hypothetical protein